MSFLPDRSFALTCSPPSVNRTLYVCEIKFSRNTIGTEVIDEMKRKIKALKTPKQYFCRPVLIHVNGVSDELVDSQYFSDIIEMAQLFE